MLVAVLAAQSAMAASKRPVVVELYTSQGCSSCPPADAFLAKLALRPDVIALSLPVTYWDMFGWKDTLANAANTNRQKAYAAAMGRGGVYTPQMIVDGVSDVVGSRVPAVNAAIAEREAVFAARSDAPVVPVSLESLPQEWRVTVGGAKTAGTRPNATIWLFEIRRSVTVHIGSGENGGRTITYRNVVDQVKAVGMWKGEAVKLDLPRDAGAQADDAAAVVVQQNGYGPVLGAAFGGRQIN